MGSYDDGGTQNVGYEEYEPEPESWGKLISHTTEIPSHTLVGSDVTVIGRGADSTIQINKLYISSTHCKIYRIQDDTYCEDCSSNGTFILTPNAPKSEKLSKSKKVIQPGTKIILVKHNAKQKIDEICFTYLQTNNSDTTEKYQTGKELGRGAFATVFLGYKDEDLQPVAIKKFEKRKLTNSQSSNPNSLDHVKQEANLLKKIQHKGVINFLDDYEDEEHYNLVMEYASGGELTDYLDQVPNKRLSEDEARTITAQILDVLQYLHDRGIVHRDLKLENILFEDKKHKVIKLSDFGISKLVGEGVFLQTMCGTPDYLAPEIFQSGAGGYTSAVDMWSLGIIVYKLVTGNHPYKDCKKQTVMGEVLDDSFDFPPDIPVSPTCKDFIKQLLTKDPQRRLTAKDASKHAWMRNTSILKRDRKSFTDVEEPERIKPKKFKSQ